MPALCSLSDLRAPIQSAKNRPYLRHARCRSPAALQSSSTPKENPMAQMAEGKLKNLGIALPTPPNPVANYVGFVRSGALLFVSGQICFGADGKLVAKGRLGDNVSVEDGQKAARACAVNLLAQIKAALGDLDKVVRVVRLCGLIKSGPGFVHGSKVVYGAVDLLDEVVGVKGRQVRT